MSVPRRILFVCRANRFRSPLAVALFRRMVEQDPVLSGLHLELRSAGPDAEGGLSASEIAFRYAKELGVNLESHRATPLAEAVDWPDMAVCMERSQRDLVRQLNPDVAAYLLPWFATGNMEQQMVEPFPPGTPTPWPPGIEELFGESIEEIKKYLPSLAEWLKKEAVVNGD